MKTNISWTSRLETKLFFSLMLIAFASTGCAVSPQFAAMNGDSASLSEYIRQGKDINNQDSHGNTALFVAASYGHTDIARLLIVNGANLDLQNKVGDFALVVAASKGHTDFVQLLIEHGAQLDLQDQYGSFALFQAADKGYLGIARLLVEKGAKLDLQYQNGDSALNHAVTKGRTDIARLLIDKGANLDLQNRYGDTALTLASGKDHTDIAHMLIEKGAKLDLQNKNDNSALILAASEGHTDIARMLIEKGAKLDVQNQYGDTALTHAASKGYTDIARMLIEKGAKLDVQNQGGNSALILATSERHTDIALFLIEKGARLDLQTQFGYTALAVAALKGNTRLVLGLLKNGADPLLGAIGKRPLDLARSKNHTEIVAILERATQGIVGGNGLPQVASGGEAPRRLKLASTGTGIRIDTAGAIITNHHVVDECTEIRVADQVLRTISLDPVNDLALLQGKPGSSARIRASNHIRTGESVTVVGFPLRSILGSGIQANSGEISALSGIKNDSRFLQTSAPVNSGNSGGPLFDRTGSIVGMVTSRLNAAKMLKITGDIPQNINFAIKSSILKSFLDINHVRYSSPTQGVEKSTADIVDESRGYIFPLECWN